MLFTNYNFILYLLDRKVAYWLAFQINLYLVPAESYVYKFDKMGFHLLPFNGLINGKVN